METITSILTGYNDTAISKFNKIMTRANKDLVKNFVDMAKNLTNFIGKNIREDQGLADYRKEYNQACKELGLNGSNYGFSNILKAGYLADKNLAWMLSFNSLSSLTVGLAGFKSVPACNGIKALEIVPVKGNNIQAMIEKIDPSLDNAQLRETIGLEKGNRPAEDSALKVEKSQEVDSKPIVTESKQSKLDNDSKPVNNGIESIAINLAKTIADYRNQEGFLLALAVNLQKFKVIISLKREIDELLVNTKRVDLTIE